MGLEDLLKKKMKCIYKLKLILEEYSISDKHQNSKMVKDKIREASVRS